MLTWYLFYIFLAKLFCGIIQAGRTRLVLFCFDGLCNIYCILLHIDSIVLLYTGRITFLAIADPK